MFGLDSLYALFHFAIVSSRCVFEMTFEILIFWARLPWTYVHTGTCIHTYLPTHLPTDIYTCIRQYECTGCQRPRTSDMHNSMNTYAPTYVHACIYIYRSRYRYRCRYAHMYTHDTASSVFVFTYTQMNGYIGANLPACGHMHTIRVHSFCLHCHGAPVRLRLHQDSSALIKPKPDTQSPI